MIEFFQSLENHLMELGSVPKVQKPELPALIRIGNYAGNTAKIPVMLPLEAMNGLCFETNQQTRTDALRQMQYMALNLLKQVSPEVLNLTFVDIGLNTNFPMLHSLNEQHNIKFITDRENLKREIEALFEKARYISTKCLGGFYADLKEYNNDADYKEPYHILFISNFPKEFGEDEINFVSEMINEGAKCGIQVIMNLDKDFFPEDDNYNRKRFAKLYDISKQMPYLDCTKSKATLNNFDNKTIHDFFAKYDFEFENYPPKELKTLIDTLNQQSEQQDNLSENFLSIPIGRKGRDEICFELGKKADVYSGLIAGAVGTGKSTLLNNIIVSIADKYSPDEVQLYLLDYKDGVEFNQYKEHPNVELLLLDNSRIDVGYEILQQFQSEIEKRNNKFKELQDLLKSKKVADIDTFNKIAPDKKIPRLLMIIDEAQRLFTDDYSYNKKVNGLVSDVARRGRSAGIHLLLSSQTYMNTKFEDEAKNQMRLRISYQLATPLDCMAILRSDNRLPLSLKKYQLVYNTNFGSGENEDNKIVDTYDFETEKANEILKRAAEKYPNHKPKIITAEMAETAEAPQTQADNEWEDWDNALK